MTREEAGELLEIMRVLWPAAKLPAAMDWKTVEAYKTEAATMFEAYTLEDVRGIVRELARSTEWLPSFAAMLKALEAKTGTEGRKGSRAYQYDEWITDADGYEAVKTYTIVRHADGGIEIPKAIQGRATRAELLKRKILTTDDLIEMAKRGELTAEEFTTIKGPDGKPADGRWRLDHYVYQPERVLAALSGRTSPENAVLSAENREKVQDTIYSFFERVTGDFDDIPF